MPWEHTANPHNCWVPGSCGLLPQGVLWFSYTPADSKAIQNGSARLEWKGLLDLERLLMQRLIDLCHLTSAQRIKGGCVIGMLMPAAPSVPPYVRTETW